MTHYWCQQQPDVLHLGLTLSHDEGNHVNFGQIKIKGNFLIDYNL